MEDILSLLGQIGELAQKQAELESELALMRRLRDDSELMRAVLTVVRSGMTPAQYAMCWHSWGPQGRG